MNIKKHIPGKAVGLLGGLLAGTLLTGCASLQDGNVYYNNVGFTAEGAVEVFDQLKTPKYKKAFVGARVYEKEELKERLLAHVGFLKSLMKEDFFIKAKANWGEYDIDKKKEYFQDTFDLYIKEMAIENAHPFLEYIDNPDTSYVAYFQLKEKKIFINTNEKTAETLEDFSAANQMVSHESHHLYQNKLEGETPHSVQSQVTSKLRITKEVEGRVHKIKKPFIQDTEDGIEFYNGRYKEDMWTYLKSGPESPAYMISYLTEKVLADGDVDIDKFMKEVDAERSVFTIQGKYTGLMDSINSNPEKFSEYLEDGVIKRWEVPHALDLANTLSANPAKKAKQLAMDNSKVKPQKLDKKVIKPSNKLKSP